MKTACDPRASAIDAEPRARRGASWKLRPATLALAVAGGLTAALPVIGAPSAPADPQKPAPDAGPALDEFLARIERVPSRRAPGDWRRRTLHTRNPAGQITALRLRNAKLQKNDFVVIGALQHLESLDLGHANVADDDLAHLKGLGNLRSLSLDWSAVGDAGLAHLQGLSRLEELDLRLTKVTGAGLVALRGLRNLRRLDVSDTRIGDAALRHVAELANLELLHLGDTKITDAGLGHLKGLKHLRGLTLNETGITDEGLKVLATLPRFKWISSPVSAAEEFVRRLERSDFNAVKEMYSPGVYMPHRGRLKLKSLDPLPKNKKDARLNRLRFRLEMHWTAEAERINTVVYATFAVDHGAISVHSVGIRE